MIMTHPPMSNDHSDRSGLLTLRSRPRDEHGAVTVETAVVMPAIALLLAVVLAVGAAAALQVRTEKAAGAAARVMARGEPASAAQEEARAVAGRRASVDVDVRGERATAEVAVPAPGVLGHWRSLTLTAQATALVETRGSDPEVLRAVEAGS